jgi:hypothetical protein
VLVFRKKLFRQSSTPPVVTDFRQSQRLIIMGPATPENQESEATTSLAA